VPRRDLSFPVACPNAWGEVGRIPRERRCGVRIVRTGMFWIPMPSGVGLYAIACVDRWCFTNRAGRNGGVVVWREVSCVYRRTAFRRAAVGQGGPGEGWDGRFRARCARRGWGPVSLSPQHGGGKGVCFARLIPPGCLTARSPAMCCESQAMRFRWLAPSLWNVASQIGLATVYSRFRPAVVAEEALQGRGRRYRGELSPPRDDVSLKCRESAERWPCVGGEFYGSTRPACPTGGPN